MNGAPNEWPNEWRFPMKVTTREKQELTVSVKWLSHEPEGIISFRYSNGMLCTSYYLSAFQGADGFVKLDGAYLDQQTLTPDVVRSCQRFIEACKELREKNR